MRSLLSHPLGNPASNFTVGDLIWMIPISALMGFGFVMAWGGWA